MQTLTKEQKRILKHIITLPKSANNTISIGNKMPTYPDNINDKELIQILIYFEQCNFIKIKWFSPHHDTLNYAVEITLLPEGNDYFKNKKHTIWKSIKDNIKWLLPLIISILSLIWNICNTIYGWYLSGLIDLKQKLNYMLLLLREYY